jgi:hypothetical protein
MPSALRLPAFGQRGTSADVLLFQFLPDAIAVLDVQSLRYVKIFKQPSGLHGIASTAGQVRDYLLLKGDMPLALGDVSLGLLEVS